MRLTFALKAFPDRQVNAHLATHFLLEPARLAIRLTFADSSEKFLPLVARNAGGAFVVDIDPDDVPEKADATGTPHKLQITRLLMDLFVDFRFEGKTYRLLRIVQEFSLTPGRTNGETVIDYVLAPFAWVHSVTLARKRSNGGVHPLLDLRKLARGEVGVNTLVVDLTDLWDHLHRKNRHTKRYRELTEPGKVTFKVFAHLGGNAFIWYGIVPAYVAASPKVSPHVFYSPSDWAPQQNLADEKRYLFDNDVQFEAQNASDTAFNGHVLFLNYLLPPIDDDRIASLKPTRFPRGEFRDWVRRFRRNVVTFKYVDPDKKGDIRINHWRIGAGFERAFYGLGKAKPQQILLMPQVIGDGGLRASKGSESTAHLRHVTDAILDLLQTGTTHLAAATKDVVIQKDKIVLSCYSESGHDLWRSCEANADAIKAIIGIEPNATNPTGQRIIPGLLKKKIKVFIVGHHEGFYRPKIDARLQKLVRYLPDEPLKVLKYPPDPGLNDFVKFRTARVTSETLDPLMSADEKAILRDLASRTPPKKGTDAIPVVFTPLADSYNLKDRDLLSIFYTHNFALTGGQEMTLASATDFYGKPVAYRTFFQQAVEEIG
jgi:hypothetical protein